MSIDVEYDTRKDMQIYHDFYGYTVLLILDNYSNSSKQFIEITFSDSENSWYLKIDDDNNTNCDSIDDAYIFLSRCFNKNERFRLSLKFNNDGGIQFNISFAINSMKIHFNYILDKLEFNVNLLDIAERFTNCNLLKCFENDTRVINLRILKHNVISKMYFNL